MGVVAFAGGLDRRRRVGVDGAAGRRRAAVQLVDLHQVGRAEAVALAQRASARLDCLYGRVAVLEGECYL